LSGDLAAPHPLTNKPFHHSAANPPQSPSIHWFTTFCTERAFSLGSKRNNGYGVACYRPGGCADIIQAVAERIDARQFNPHFPQTFPRFVQYAIWQYCAQDGLDVCNGNRINDARRCENNDCRVRLMCDRVVLRSLSKT
jgi:hypothetical protein